MLRNMEERCETCEAIRHHEIHIELVAENTTRDSAPYSREPYRVTTCLECGTTTQTRMNGA